MWSRRSTEYCNGSVGEILYEFDHITGLETEFRYHLDLQLNEEMYDITLYAFDRKKT